jgi:hypothetical protein
MGEISGKLFNDTVTYDNNGVTKWVDVCGPIELKPALMVLSPLIALEKNTAVVDSGYYRGYMSYIRWMLGKCPEQFSGMKFFLKRFVTRLDFKFEYDEPRTVAGLMGVFEDLKVHRDAMLRREKRKAIEQAVAAALEERKKNRRVTFSDEVQEFYYVEPVTVVENDSQQIEIDSDFACAFDDFDISDDDGETFIVSSDGEEACTDVMPVIKHVTVTQQTVIWGLRDVRQQFVAAKTDVGTDMLLVSVVYATHRRQVSVLLKEGVIDCRGKDLEEFRQFTTMLVDNHVDGQPRHKVVLVDRMTIYDSCSSRFPVFHTDGFVLRKSFRHYGVRLFVFAVLKTQVCDFYNRDMETYKEYVRCYILGYPLKRCKHVSCGDPFPHGYCYLLLFPRIVWYYIYSVYGEPMMSAYEFAHFSAWTDGRLPHYTGFGFGDDISSLPLVVNRGQVGFDHRFTLMYRGTVLTFSGLSRRWYLRLTVYVLLTVFFAYALLIFLFG